MHVSPCSVVTCLLFYVLTCVVMLHRVPLHVRVSPETRQRLRHLRTERRLNVGAWLRSPVGQRSAPDTFGAQNPAIFDAH